METEECAECGHGIEEHKVNGGACEMEDCDCGFFVLLDA